MKSTPAPQAFDPASVTFDALEGPDPEGLFENLRTQAPIVYAPQADLWLVTSWDACSAIAALPDAHTAGGEDDNRFFGTPNILSMEGAAHRELRRGIDEELRPRAVRGYVDELARKTVVDYIERIRPLGRADLTTELFERISVRVIGDKLGLGDVDAETLVRWFKTLSEGLEQQSRENADAAVAAAAAVREIDDYLRDRVAQLQQHPDASIISHMVHTGTPDGHPRSFDEVAPSIRVIILGGFQEPGNAVANTFHGLFTRPEQLALLAADPQRYAAPALEEGLRWIAPIHAVQRTSTREIVTEWGRIPSNTPMMLVVGAANRDRARFADADRYDLERSFLPNATFGYGEHFCAGHALARALGQIVIEETVTRLPGLRPDPEAQPEVSGFFFRGAKHVPARWTV